MEELRKKTRNLADDDVRGVHFASAQDILNRSLQAAITAPTAATSRLVIAHCGMIPYGSFPKLHACEYIHWNPNYRF
jgi:hypothetical protein